MQIQATKVFEKTWNAIQSDCRFIVSEGGSRSSKTYSICQVVILYALQNPKCSFSVVRSSFPALRGSIMRDFFEILEAMELYDPENHSKTDHIYKFPNGSYVEFFSADDQQKLRGRKRDFCIINEANELDYDSFQQLNLRTTKKMLVDYNPSAVESYLYHLPEDKTVMIHSTYKDNPFLSPEIIQEIENYQFTDEDYYQIFTLGKRCFSRENVYSKWEISEKPKYLTEWIYGIDFGFTHETALVRIFYHPDHNEVFVEELIYESHLTSQDIIKKMELVGVDKTKIVVTETARPEIVSDLKRVGYKTVPAIKNVQEGILVVKGFKVCISANSKNIEKENFNYRYKKVNGVILEEPIKLYDHAMDALRYGLFYIKKHCLKTPGKKSQIYSFDF